MTPVFVANTMVGGGDRKGVLRTTQQKLTVVNLTNKGGLLERTLGVSEQWQSLASGKEEGSYQGRGLEDPWGLQGGIPGFPSNIHASADRFLLTPESKKEPDPSPRPAHPCKLGSEPAWFLS